MIVRYAALTVLMAVAACSPGGGQAPAPATASAAGNKVVGINGVEGEVNGRIIAGSRFSRIRIGMGSREVESIIGPPTDTASHITGKQFIPFYFGGDMAREESFYRGEGQLTYTHPSIGSSALVLIGITVDPSERGFAH